MCRVHRPDFVHPRMNKVILNEVTTVPGLINVIGALIMLSAKPVATVLDKVMIAALMVFGRKDRDEHSPYQQRLKELIEALLPDREPSSRQLPMIAAVFVVYNVICVLLVNSTG